MRTFHCDVLYIKQEIVEPAGAKYDPGVSGTIAANDVVYKAFQNSGWEWGGEWDVVKDYQHFEKSR